MGLYMQLLHTTRWLSIWPCFFATAARSLLGLYKSTIKRLVAGKQESTAFPLTQERSSIALDSFQVCTETGSFSPYALMGKMVDEMLRTRAPELAHLRVILSMASVAKLQKYCSIHCLAGERSLEGK